MLIFVATRGNTFFEISNHLGNVHLVLSDYRSITDDEDDNIIGYHSSVLSASEYYPLGMLLVEGQYYSGSYRYGFNTMEKDDEIKGLGNSYDFGARMYDPRLGRWLAVDPSFPEYPPVTPFHFSLNNPIIFRDYDGRVVVGSDGEPVTYTRAESGQIEWSSNATEDIRRILFRNYNCFFSRKYKCFR